YPAARALIEGIAEGSPYLWDLIRADPARLVRLLNADPDRRLPEILNDTFGALDVAHDEEAAMRQLRAMKAEAALLIALADIGGMWPLDKITAGLTDLADTAVRGALRFLLRGTIERGKLTPHDSAAPEQGSGYVVVAMGKMGARELNYSSDIDLIVFYDPDTAAVS